MTNEANGNLAPDIKGKGKAMARSISTLFLLLLLGTSPMATAREVLLEDLDLRHVYQGWGKAQPRQSVQKQDMTIAGKTYKHGVGSHAPGALYFELDGQAKRFRAEVGVDDEVGDKGSIAVKAYGDGKLLFESPVVRGGEKPAKVDLDLGGIHLLTLIMLDDGDQSYDHLDWANARFEVDGEDPKPIPRPQEEAVILTPPPGKAPRINGPRVAGVRPGRPFLFRIPATGERPMRFSAKDLPEGLGLDAEQGIISGVIQSPEHHTYPVTLAAENGEGTAERELRIVVGDTLALTPPMGWNHWYAHYDQITDAMVRAAADAMVASGMADVGYQYVNIDDCWPNSPKTGDPKRIGPLRDDEGNILTNVHFPDMKALTDYIHAKGLRAGIYTSPGPFTCANFTGSWEFEEKDAWQIAEWGFDFLKYDWCSYGDIAKDKSLEELKKPYILMGDILKELDRDVVFNLCQYGMGDVWTWGEEVGGHCWRTAGDLGFELTGYHRVARRNAGFREHARPGAWNDPDYLLIGRIGNQSNTKETIPCPLTPNEQYSYMSLWCLMASPLFFSGDMAHLDPFTLNVLCNPEVIDINQDPLGKQGYPVVADSEAEVWRKDLEDGSLAVGLFNLAETEQPVTAKWADLGLEGPRAVRDLWRQKDLGIVEGEFNASVPRHGVVLLRVSSAG